NNKPRKNTKRKMAKGSPFNINNHTDKTKKPRKNEKTLLQTFIDDALSGINYFDEDTTQGNFCYTGIMGTTADDLRLRIKSQLEKIGYEGFISPE
ncbi:MAG: hypothetical protein IJV00_06155, partial [Clostridia bacterium]|nr:hypothetical protein [Clostridia bacterium]